MRAESPFVSAALRIQGGPGAEPLREVVAAVDLVHRDGVLRTVSVTRRVFPETDGQYRAGTGGVPQEIIVGVEAEFPHWTVLHEIGHYLDHQALDVTGRFASEDSPLLQPWREAADRSRAVSSLRQALLTGRMAVTLSALGDVSLPVNKDYVRYQLQRREIFARSYAQWIAIRSRQERLLQQLREIRDGAGGRKYRRQWEDNDFDAIAAEIDALMRRKGWME